MPLNRKNLLLWSEGSPYGPPQLARFMPPLGLPPLPDMSCLLQPRGQLAPRFFTGFPYSSPDPWNLVWMDWYHASGTRQTAGLLSTPHVGPFVLLPLAPNTGGKANSGTVREKTSPGSRV